MMPAVMRKFRIGTLTAVGSALLISSCIADRDATGEPVTIEASGGRDAAGAGNVDEGGSSGAIADVAAGDGGRETLEPGGSSGTTASGEGGRGAGRGGTGTSSGGAAGEHDHPGGQAGAAANGGVPGGGEPSTGNAGHGGGGDAPPPPLTICLRLPSPVLDAYNATDAYWETTTRDCRISWVSRVNGSDLDAALNALWRWNLALWGCPNPGTPPDDFALLFVEGQMTSKDAEVIIGHYMDDVITRLGMSQNEIDEMRNYIEYLARGVLASDADEFSNSTCIEGTGGDGGEP